MGPTPDQNTGPRVPRPLCEEGHRGRFGPIQQVPRATADDAAGADAKITFPFRAIGRELLEESGSAATELAWTGRYARGQEKAAHIRILAAGRKGRAGAVLEDQRLRVARSSPGVSEREVERVRYRLGHAGNNGVHDIDDLGTVRRLVLPAAACCFRPTGFADCDARSCRRAGASCRGLTPTPGPRQRLPSCSN